MPTRTIFAEETVSISVFRKKPLGYFKNHAIAVLSNNRPVGYVIGSEAFETLLSILRQCEQADTFERRFQSKAAWLQELVKSGKMPPIDAGDHQITPPGGSHTTYADSQPPIATALSDLSLEQRVARIEDLLEEFFKGLAR